MIVVVAAYGVENVGRQRGSGAFVEWDVKITGHQAIELTVLSPDGESWSKSFSAGQNPSLRLSDLGTAPEDGAYNYELRVVPNVPYGIRKQLADARERGDDKAIRNIMKNAGLTVQIVQSGTITVLNGSIVSPDLVESGAQGPNAATDTSSSASGLRVSSNGKPSTPTTNDQVTPDDLIVQGSACVGLDCVSGESFGFDTLRLKENNTRIKFDDTSTSAGFANYDWQLTANDNVSGGRNKFSVEDVTSAKIPFTIEGAAPTNALYVNSTGNVGIKQSAPILDLHMTNTNTPAIRMEQTNGGGYSAQTWDIGANEANFFIRDVTSGSRLPFRIRPGAPTSSIDINAIGNVGIGTSSPAVKLDVHGTTSITDGSLGIGTTTPAAALHIINNAPGTTVARFQNSSSTGYSGFSLMDHTGTFRMYIGVDNAQATAAVAAFGTSPLTILTNNAERMRIDSSGNVGVGTTAPSSKFHVNGGDIRVSGGSFIDDGTTLNVPDYVFEPAYKLMAIDELSKFINREKHLPNVPSATNVKSAGLNVSQFQMRLLEKVEELTLYTVDQHEQISALKAQNDALLARLAALEAKISTMQ